MNKTDQYMKNRIPSLSRGDLENIAEMKLRAVYPSNLEYPTPLNVDEFIREHQGLLLKYTYLGVPAYPILGAVIMSDTAEIPACDFKMKPIVLEETRGTVLITTDLSGQNNIPRCRYTKMHESAHWILHQDAGYTACKRIERYHVKNKTSQDWMEWQADGLAAALLMPREVFVDYVRRVIRKAGGNANYLVQGNRADQRLFYEIIGDVASTFRVSHRAAQIRMIHLGLIKTASAF